MQADITESARHAMSRSQRPCSRTLRVAYQQPHAAGQRCRAVRPPVPQTPARFDGHCVFRDGKELDRALQPLMAASSNTSHGPAKSITFVPGPIATAVRMLPLARTGNYRPGSREAPARCAAECRRERQAYRGADSRSVNCLLFTSDPVEKPSVVVGEPDRTARHEAVTSTRQRAYANVVTVPADRHAPRPHLRKPLPRPSAERCGIQSRSASTRRLFPSPSMSIYAGLPGLVIDLMSDVPQPVTQRLVHLDHQALGRSSRPRWRQACRCRSKLASMYKRELSRWLMTHARDPAKTMSDGPFADRTCATTLFLGSYTRMTRRPGHRPPRPSRCRSRCCTGRDAPSLILLVTRAAAWSTR